MRDASPAVLGGRNSGDALEASSALNYRDWGIQPHSRGEFQIRSESVSGVLPDFLGTSSGMSQPYWGCGPFTVQKGWATSGKCIVIGIDYCHFSLATTPCKHESLCALPLRGRSSRHKVSAGESTEESFCVLSL